MRFRQHSQHGGVLKAKTPRRISNSVGIIKEAQPSATDHLHKAATVGRHTQGQNKLVVFGVANEAIVSGAKLPAITAVMQHFAYQNLVHKFGPLISC